MAAEALAPWVDIPPLAAPAMGPAEWWTLLWPPLLVLAVVAGLFYAWWRQPRRRQLRRIFAIRRALQQGRLEARAALYALAACLGPAALPEALQQLLYRRYQAAEPEPSAVLAALQAAHGWLQR